MLKAGRTLKSTYPELVHVTCLSHALNLVAEQVRSLFPNVDSLVASLKKVFKKAPSRVCKYQEMNPGLKLPPEAVITRWGTWLKAVELYALHFDKIKAVIDTFDPSDAAAINTAQNLMAKSTVFHELTYVSANFTFLCVPILDLQQRNSSLSSTLQTIADTRAKLQAINGSMGYKVLQKFDSVIAKNADLLKVRAISKVIDGTTLDDTETGLLETLSPAKIASFKFAQLTTFEFERSFSMHGTILAPNRRRMTTQNLEMAVVSHSYFAS